MPLLTRGLLTRSLATCRFARLHLTSRRSHFRRSPSIMPSNDYHFIDCWRVEGNVNEVSDIIEDALSLSTWWPSVYFEVQELEPGGEGGVGKLSDCARAVGCLTLCALISAPRNHVIQMALRWTRLETLKEKASGLFSRTDRSSTSLTIGRFARTNQSLISSRFY